MSRLTFLGHATLKLQTAGLTILIDPFFTGNPQATETAEQQQADFIIITHGHGDHVGDAVEIAKRTGATVIANFEICNWFTQQGVEKVHAQHIGGGHQYPFGRLKLTIAHHGSQLPDGSYGGNPCGLLLTLPEGTIYHAADTGLFYDMKLIGEEGVDVAILPIGDNYTMGPEDALRAVKLISPRKVVPLHYDTWPVIEQDEAAWARRVRAETDCEPVILEAGEFLEI